VLIAIGIIFYAMGAPTRAKTAEVPLGDPSLTAEVT